MMVQRDLFGNPPKPRKATPEEKFRMWVFANEKVVDIFLQFAREARDRGKGKFGIGAIAEQVRWEVYIRRKEADPYKINNNYRSRLARLLVQRDPSLAGMFKFRKLRPR